MAANPGRAAVMPCKPRRRTECKSHTQHAKTTEKIARQVGGQESVFFFFFHPRSSSHVCRTWFLLAFVSLYTVVCRFLAQFIGGDPS